MAQIISLCLDFAVHCGAEVVHMVCESFLRLSLTILHSDVESAVLVDSTENRTAEVMDLIWYCLGLTASSLTWFALDSYMVCFGFDPPSWNCHKSSMKWAHLIQYL